MATRRHRFTAECKAQVAIEVLRGNRTNQGTAAGSSRRKFGSRLLAGALVPVLALLLAACDPIAPTEASVRVSFAGAIYDGVEGHGVRVIVRLDPAPGRPLEIPLVVAGAGDHRLFAPHGDPDPASGTTTVRPVSAVSFAGGESEKAIFLRTVRSEAADDRSPSAATVRFGALPSAVRAGSPSSAEVKVYPAPAEPLAFIDKRITPRADGADYETIGTLPAGAVAFAEFAFANDDFASVTAMSWKETGAASNIDTRISYLRIIEAAAGADTLRLQVPVENRCPDRENAPPRSQWPCLIDDLGEPEEGLGMISDSNHILQARLGAGRYQIRVAAVSGPGPYRVSIHLNEEAQCYEEHCMREENRRES